jgi:4,5-dihydroxyphthalate decarboxylase
MSGENTTTNRPTTLSRRKLLYAAGAGSLVAATRPVTLAAAAAQSVAPAVITSSRPGAVQLSMCVSDNIRTLPLRDGRVKADAIDLSVSTIHPSEMFWRQLRFAEFDVSEMSWSSLLIAIAGGDKRWVGLPVFTSRGFPHTGILVRSDRGIERPQDLKGKKVAVPEYQQTSALWSRGILQHEFGVTPWDMEWYMERTEELSHGGATGFRPPAKLKFHRIEPPANIGTMLLDGTIDASLLYLNEVNLVDRSRVDLRNRPEVRLLFRDPVAEGARYYKKTGFYPANHCVVFKRETLERYPWTALNVYKAFVAAKEMAHAPAREVASIYFDLDLLPAAQRKALEIDPYPYGVTPNRKMLESLIQFSFEQGLTSRQLTLEDVFHPATLEL